MIDFPYLYFQITDTIEKYFQAVLLLGFRFTIAWIFWNAAFDKLLNWQISILYFQDTYPVYWIPPQAWAYFFVGLELLCPMLILLGFAARIASLPLTALTAMISLITGTTMDHLYWALLLLSMITFGPGPLSIDAGIRKHYQKHLF